MYWIIRRYHLLVTVAACIAVLLCAISVNRMHAGVSMAVSAVNTNWGLRFHEDGATPTGNATADFLKQYGAFYVGDTTKKIIYLTFDAGYDNGYTAPILDTLKRHNVSATFFVVGHFLDSKPDLVKRMVAEGHLVGNHTDSHPDMSAIGTAEGFTRELTALETRYREITGAEMPKLYRPPRGKYSEQNLQMAYEKGYTTCFWSLAYVDWYTDDQPTKDEAFSKLLPRIHPGAVVLLHSTSRTNCEILDELLTKWKEMGYSFGKLTDI